MSSLKPHKTKVLLLIDWFLPGTASGGPVRSYANMMAQLQTDYEFYVITRHTDYGSSEPYSVIPPNQWVQQGENWYGYYLSQDQLHQKTLKNLLEQTAFDVALINGIYSWYFSIYPLVVLKRLNVPYLVSARGMLNPQAFSVKPLKKRVFLQLAKIIKLYHRVPFHATNSQEAAYIRVVLGSRTKIYEAPNVPRPIPAKPTQRNAKQHPVRLVSVARVAKEKGTLRLLKALERLSTPVHLDLYGPIYDTDYWAVCKTQVEKLPEHIAVHYQGPLESELVPKTLLDYDFFAMLSEGENFGHAILEALSSGLPVLISNRTPWTNLRAERVGWDVALEDKNDIQKAFTEALSMPQEVYSLWSDAAYNYANDFCSNPELVAQTKEMLAAVIKDFENAK